MSEVIIPEYSACADAGGETQMPDIGLGDRVEIVGEGADRFQSKIGVITAVEDKAVSSGKFTVRLADGTEAVFPDSQLQIPPVVFGDMILDTKVSPVLSGVRGYTVPTSMRHMRFISREFDIYVKLAGSQGQKNLLGEVSASERAEQPFLITLLFDDKPFASTTTDAGEFNFRAVPSGNAMLEVLVPSRRIMARFEV